MKKQNQACKFHSDICNLIVKYDILITDIGIFMNQLSEHLKQQWHSVKNSTANIETFTTGSRYKAWWQCDKNHEWEASIASRSSGVGCPYCSNRKVLYGFNDLETKHPAIAQQWHPTKNSLTPAEVVFGSARKVWWQCSREHEWQAPIESRVWKKTGCSVCSNKKVLAGFNDLKTKYPKIAQQWHPTRNDSLLPSAVLFGSHKKVWWLCDKGHEWETTVSKRTSMQRGCHVCSGQKVVTGLNDFATTHPELASEWHPIKNGMLVPEKMIGAGVKKVWWQCKQGHEWETSVNARKSKGRNCPYCSNQRVLQGVNDFATTHPELAAEWHPVKNHPFLPTDVTHGANKIGKIWWLGACGHEWSARLSDKKRYGCPICPNQVSQAENDLFTFLKQAGVNVIQSDKSILGNRELDLYLPDHQIAIEYNGLYWHTEGRGRGQRKQDYHYRKYTDTQKQGVQLIQVWEDEWIQNPFLVKKSLAQKLLTKELDEFTLTVVSAIDEVNAEAFFAEHHVHGFAAATHYVGLEGSDGVLRGLLAFNALDDDVVELVRYAASGSVFHAFELLLPHVVKTYSPQRIVFVSDNAFNEDRLLSSYGFIADEVLPPDYMYVVGKKRFHKSEYSFKRFRNDPNLLWEEGLTEFELADLNKIPRIWDAGKTRYVKHVN